MERAANCVDQLGFPRISAEATADYRDLAHTVQRPGAWAAFVHGDLTPNNAVLGDDGVCRFVDFEGSGVQHVGLDMAMLRFPFAWYTRWAAVPASVQSAMEQAYRDALDQPPSYVDDAMAVGCLAMAALRLERLPRIADSTQPPDLARRRRVQIVDTVDVAVGAATHVGLYPDLVEWLCAMSDAVRARWPEARAEPPVYPAFGPSRAAPT